MISKRIFGTLAMLLCLSRFAFAQEHIYFETGGSVRTTAFSPVNASLAASAGDENTIKLWNLSDDTGTTMRGHTDIVNDVEFSPDGWMLASGSDDYTLRLWNVRQNRETATLQHITDRTRSQIKAVTFSPDGQLLASAGVHVKLWNVRDRQEIATLRDEKWALAVDFSPNGEQLAVGYEDGTVKIWNVQRQRVVATREGDARHVFSVKFSQDSQLLASAGYHGEIRLWDVAGWQHRGTLHTRIGTVRDIAFSENGKALASASREVVHLWDVQSGAQLTALRGHSGWVNALAFSIDRTTLVSGGEDGTLRFWDVAPYLSPERTAERDIVRLIYFLPQGRSVQPDMWANLDTLISDVQQFYAAEMQRHGFGRKSFTFETDETGETLVHQVDGKFREQYYHNQTSDKVRAEVTEQFDISNNVYLIAVDISSQVIDNENTCGVGGSRWFGNEEHQRVAGGYALIPASGECFDNVQVAAHELGHAFGLEHDFRSDAYLMSYGIAPNQLSKCAAEWLDASRFFNAEQTSFNEPTTLQLLSQQRYPPNARNFTLQFKIADADGLHQAQLLIPTTRADLALGFKLHSCQRLRGQNSVVEFVTTGLTSRRVNDIGLQVIDVNGNITRQEWTLRADDSLIVQNPLDVNGDGTVNVADLVLIASNFGKTVGQKAHPNPDVNSDGIVDITDLLLVASALQAAPAQTAQLASQVQGWIEQAVQLTPRDATVEKGIAVLEGLLAVLRPVQTALLPNYPNPFNPETWMPYQLAEDAEVTFTIYDARGRQVRQLDLGHRPVGIYQARTRAAYWDGRNEIGEPVASGLYFYTLSAGKFAATRKMFVRK